MTIISNGIDDTKTLSDAFNSGLPVSLIGKFTVKGPIIVNLNENNPGLNIVGGGKGMSQILLATSDASITINIADVASPYGLSEQVVLRDFSIVPTTVINDYALYINAASATGSSESTFFFENVHLLPLNINCYSKNGFYFNNCRNSTLSSCIVAGQYGQYSGNGIAWTGAANSAPVDLHLRDCEPTWWGKGLALLPNTGNATTGANDWQGIYIRGGTFLACDTGVSATTSDNFSSLLMIDGTHFNFRSFGINTENVDRVFITNTFMLCEGTVPYATGIYTNMSSGKSQYGFITNNVVDFSAVTGTIGTRIGIVATNSSGQMLSQVSPNFVIDATTAYTISGSNFTTPKNRYFPTLWDNILSFFKNLF